MPRLILTLLLLLPGLAIAELEISNAYIKNLPPSVPVRAGYMSLHNPLERAQRIVAVASEAFASVEIHQTSMQDGMMRMQRVDSLTIEAGATLRLAPGGLHLMMMQPVAATSPGQTHSLTIEFADGSRQQVDMTVVK